MSIKHFFTLVLLVVFFQFSFSQIVTNELPLGVQLKLGVEKIEKIQVSPIVNLLTTSEIKPIAQQFAYLINTDISPLNEGHWTDVSGGRVWQLVIQSKGAYSLNFTLEPFLLPLGAKLFFYSADNTYIVGAITAANNKDFKKLPIQAIPGDMVIVEYFLPDGVDFKNDFRITRIGHDFKNAFGSHESGPCEVNVNCAEGDDWQIEKRSVAKIIIDNSYYCTGALINNTKQDARPYLLTAAHCIHQFSEAENSVFYFNYESADCEGTSTPPIQTIGGSSLIATGKNENLDFTLLELSVMPPESFEPYLAGWNREAIPSSDVTSIHHPDGDIKKISRDYDATIIGDFGYGYDSYSHWQILQWDVGTTEGGSSGSPLFDAEHLIIGDLTGGEANCVNPVNDYYARFDKSWEDYSEDFYQLKTWLDPTGSGTMKLEGFDPYSQKYKWDLSAYLVHNIEDIGCSDSISPYFIVKNQGLEKVDSFEYDLYIDEILAKSGKYNTTLNSGFSINVYLGSIHKDFGDHTLAFIVKNPNGEQDENSINDTIYKEFNLLNGVALELELKTDDYAYETWWELENSQNEVIYSSDVYGDTTLYTSNFCLEYSCYIFKMYDQSSDGICCDFGNGYYSLRNSFTDEVIASGGEFLDEDFSSFCLTPSGLNQTQDFPYRMFPNPASYLNPVIEVFLDSAYSVNIFNLNGKLLYSENEVYNRSELNLSNWENGIYIIHLSSGDKHVVDKLIIMK